MPSPIPEKLIRLKSAAERMRRRELTESYVYRFLPRLITCPDCGRQVKRKPPARRCVQCQRRRTLERRRHAQQARRKLQSDRYDHKIEKSGAFLVAVNRVKKITCQQCGRTFLPARATARFCSAKCRVSWNRAR